MARTLEKYEIVDEIGHGGMATVYRARDTVLEREVALKVLHPHLRSAEEARRRFHREARSVARLRHPRVLEIYDFSGVGSDDAFIASELLTGPTLKAFREEQADMPAEVAAAFGIEIARALEAAHEAGIIHRDVKPENVLLHEDRELKLTDFGIADMVDAQSMTATGQILGSPGHMAPEQIEGKDCDARTDLFSLGTVLYYLATGRLPFTGRNPHQVLRRIMESEYADPLRLRPAIGERLRGIIVKALHLDPDDRFQTARELREALERFVAEIGIDDPGALLARYLKDPDAVADEVRARAVGHLIGAGTRASDAGDIHGALDCYNRVLALDEGNEEVLRLVQRVGQDRRRRMALVGAGLMAAGVVAATIALGVWASRPPPATLASTSATTALAGGPEETLAAARPPTDLEAAVDSGSGGGAPPDPRGRDAGPPLPSRTVARVSRPRHANGTRRVVIRSRPPVVWVRIDGEGSWYENAPGFSPELSLGSHTFDVQARVENNPYRRTTFREVVRAGSGPQRLDFELPYEGAMLQVNSSADGAVAVDGQPVGATNTVHTSRESASLRMNALERQVTLTVSFPNREPIVRRATLQAGRPLVLRVDPEP
ncbi:MAG: serine/threonine-protein kinase [Sandaracinaceae bacterium]